MQMITSLLLDQWVSGSGAHVVKGLELSNDEWPRLNNREVRKNIYVFRETNPAARIRIRSGY